MSQPSRFLIRDGLVQGAVAAGAAGATAFLIAMSSANRFGFAGRVALTATGLFVVALLLGSARAISLTTLPMLGAAIAAFSATGQTMWIRSIVIGILWYVASELAWDAIERRGGATRSPAIENRRAFEVSTVATIALAITAVGFLASNLAPTRTLLTVGLVVLGLFVALGMATRHVDEAGPDTG